MLKLSAAYKTHVPELPGLFRDVFTASEGEAEGETVGALAEDLLATTPQEDLFGVLALDDDMLVGCILFSRLRYQQDRRQVFLMSPVAVRTDRQRGGIGQQLIRFGLDDLRQNNIACVLTYGDPAYYGKTGFDPITEDIAQAPMPLSMPHGWLGQSLSGQKMNPIAGPCSCAPAFNRPELW